ncbi:hypothetical protein B0T24DRAFT_164143 [Lasiosphaeria ovina]|uniref:Uncharacterized protein n=1 Tax=Lasiosphaeria ovina TaxID=92902 RepID=A0AAE0TSA3_9PEZI|nr:hypothetical protein B0T24DRAFT_164143 [Lasiosphaeria ovina]
MSERGKVEQLELEQERLRGGELEQANGGGIDQADGGEREHASGCSDLNQAGRCGPQQAASCCGRERTNCTRADHRELARIGRLRRSQNQLHGHDMEQINGGNKVQDLEQADYREQQPTVGAQQADCGNVEQADRRELRKIEPLRRKDEELDGCELEAEQVDGREARQVKGSGNLRNNLVETHATKVHQTAIKSSSVKTPAPIYWSCPRPV